MLPLPPLWCVDTILFLRPAQVVHEPLVDRLEEIAEPSFALVAFCFAGALVVAHTARVLVVASSTAWSVRKLLAKTLDLVLQSLAF